VTHRDAPDNEDQRKTSGNDDIETGTKPVPEEEPAPVGPSGGVAQAPRHKSIDKILSGSPYLTPNEAATYCRCSKRRIRDWVKRGLLAVAQDADGRRHFRREDLDAVMLGGPVCRAPIEPAARHRALPTRSRQSRLRKTQPRTNPEKERR